MLNINGMPYIENFRFTASVAGFCVAIMHQLSRSSTAWQTLNALEGFRVAHFSLRAKRACGEQYRNMGLLTFSRSSYSTFFS